MNKNLRILGALPVILLGALGAANARADYLAFTPPGNFSPGTNSSDNTPGSLGLMFTTNATLTVDELGFFDIPNLTSGETVTLYDSTGNALTSAFVPLTSTVDDGYFMQSITPLVIAPGTYTIAAFIGDNPFEFYVGVVAGAGIASVSPSGDFSLGSTPSYPNPQNDALDGNDYYGATFEVSTNVQGSAPEPGAWIMVAAGLALLGFTRAVRAFAPAR